MYFLRSLINLFIDYTHRCNNGFRAIWVELRHILNTIFFHYLLLKDNTLNKEYNRNYTTNFNFRKIIFSKNFFYIFFFKIVNLIDTTSFKKNRFEFRLNQTNWGFYFSKNNFFYKNNLQGLKFLFKFFKSWLVSLLLFSIIYYYLVYIRLLPFNKLIALWVLVVMFLYWLFSGFVFFSKKYQFNKYTTAIQRFWKRTYIIFWLIEIGTFLVFFYLTINSTSEPVYMYDQLKLYKTHLFSWRMFLYKMVPFMVIILLCSYLLTSLKWSSFSKQSNILIAITIILLYILWLEFYQFFHILSFYSNINWVFDYDEYIWSLELDSRRTRLYNNYIALCLFAKFWHFVFIFIFWVFFLLRVQEQSRIRYGFLAANFQNFIIIYMMSWVYMYPWVKFIFRKLLDTPYYWFFLNGRDLGFRVFFVDIKLFFYSLTNYIYDFKFLINAFKHHPFYYWISSSPFIDYNQYRRLVVRDAIIATLNQSI